MKSWNRIGKIKAIIIGIAGLYNLFMPFKFPVNKDIASNFIFPSITAIVLPVILILINPKNYKRTISEPSWNDNLFWDSMAQAQFFAYFFITVGICMIISSAIKFHELNNVGLISFSVGLGIFVSIFLTLKISKKP